MCSVKSSPQHKSYSVSDSFFYILTGFSEESLAVSHVGVRLTMLLLVALGIVSSFTGLLSEDNKHIQAAPQFDYSRISLPPEHIPYFLNNNKRVAKLCHKDPFCPFKVRYALNLIQFLKLDTFYLILFGTLVCVACNSVSLVIRSLF